MALLNDILKYHESSDAHIPVPVLKVSTTPRRRRIYILNTLNLIKYILVFNAQWKLDH